MNDFTLAPEWMLDASSSFKDKNPGIPPGLNFPEISQQAYAWYFQGRDKDILLEKEFIDILPKTAELIYETNSAAEYVAWYQDTEYLHLRYRLKEANGNQTIQLFYYYPAVPKPIMDKEHLYGVLLDLFELTQYYDNQYALIPLDYEYIDMLLGTEAPKLSDPEVELVLLMMSPTTRKRFSGRLNRVRLTDPQDTVHFRRPDTSKTGKDYINIILTYIPKYLACFLPRKFLQKEHIIYPEYNIIPRKRPVPVAKVVNIEPVKNVIYAVDNATLQDRIDQHLPDVVKKFPFKVGCVVAGGFLQILSNDITYHTTLKDTVDVDVFIYGPDRKKVLDTIIQLLTEDGYGKFEILGTVINAYKKNANPIQLICGDEQHWYRIIYRFDNTATQIAYDGDEIYVSPKFIYYMTYGETLICPPSIRSDRIYKAAERGYVPVATDAFVVGSIGAKQFTGIYNKVGDRYMNKNSKLKTKAPKLTFKPIEANQIANEARFASIKSTSYNTTSIPYYDPSLPPIARFKTYGYVNLRKRSITLNIPHIVRENGLYDISPYLKLIEIIKEAEKQLPDVKRFMEVIRRELKIDLDAAYLNQHVGHIVGYIVRPHDIMFYVRNPDQPVDKTPANPGVVSDYTINLYHALYKHPLMYNYMKGSGTTSRHLKFDSRDLPTTAIKTDRNLVYTNNMYEFGAQLAIAQLGTIMDITSIIM